MQAQIDLKDMENRLRALKNVLMEQFEIENEKVAPAGIARQDNADRAFDYKFRAHKELILNRLGSQITEVEKALKRIENGTFGICTSCGKAINSERLEALPYAEHCISCQRSEQMV